MFAAQLLEAPYHCRTITQMDCLEPPKHVLLPQIAMLDQLVDTYPNAKFLLMTRESRAWAKSMIGWTTPRRGTLFERLQRSILPGLPAGEPKEEDGLVLWQLRQYAVVRKKFRHTSPHAHKFMEFSIEKGDPAKLSASQCR